MQLVLLVTSRIPTTLHVWLVRLALNKLPTRATNAVLERFPLLALQIAPVRLIERLLQLNPFVICSLQFGFDFEFHQHRMRAMRGWN